MEHIKEYGSFIDEDENSIMRNIFHSNKDFQSDPYKYTINIDTGEIIELHKQPAARVDDMQGVSLLFKELLRNNIIKWNPDFDSFVFNSEDDIFIQDTIIDDIINTIHENTLPKTFNDILNNFISVTISYNDLYILSEYENIKYLISVEKNLISFYHYNKKNKKYVFYKDKNVDNILSEIVYKFDIMFINLIHEISRFGKKIRALWYRRNNKILNKLINPNDTVIYNNGIKIKTILEYICHIDNNYVNFYSSNDKNKIGDEDMFKKRINKRYYPDDNHYNNFKSFFNF